MQGVLGWWKGSDHVSLVWEKIRIQNLNRYGFCTTVKLKVLKWKHRKSSIDEVLLNPDPGPSVLIRSTELVMSPLGHSASWRERATVVRRGRAPPGHITLEAGARWSREAGEPSLGQPVRPGPSRAPHQLCDLGCFVKDPGPYFHICKRKMLVIVSSSHRPIIKMCLKHSCPG